MTEAAPQGQGQAAPEGQQTQGDGTQVQSQDAERSYTQKDLNKIAANEKREGRQSAISELLENTGAESIEDVLAAYSEYQGIQEAVTTEADRANEKAERLEKRARAAEERYTNTLRDFALRDALRDAGVQSDSLGFVMRGIDKSNLSVDKDGNVSGVEDAVEAAKEEAPVLFGDTAQRPRVNAPQTNGTGVQTPQTTVEQSWADNLMNIIERQAQ